MTHEAEVRRAMERARRLADEANAAKSSFLAVMSHEIRTPLYGMLGTLELLSLSELDARQREQIATIQSSSRVLLQILNDLLDYSKAEAGQLELDAVAFDPVELVESTVRAQSPIALRKGVENDLATRRPTCRGSSATPDDCARPWTTWLATRSSSRRKAGLACGPIWPPRTVPGLMACA
ncbi:histidine kinase dimerization/phospho-acceptor domain-containing protein [Cupriavidus basilensis]